MMEVVLCAFPDERAPAAGATVVGIEKLVRRLSMGVTSHA